MFTGIVQQQGVIVAREGKEKISLGIQLARPLKKIRVGASVAVQGVCLTLTTVQKNVYFFDVIKETIRATNLGQLKKGERVNIEPSARFGDEIGGHMVSGHVSDTVTIKEILQEKGNVKITFHSKPVWMKYIFDKGFLTLDGCSLTVCEVKIKKATFAVWLIPETLRVTTFALKKKGDQVNMEIDTVTKTVVDTLQRRKKINP